MNWWDFVLTEKGEKALEEEGLSSSYLDILNRVKNSGYLFGFEEPDEATPASAHKKAIATLFKKGYIEESPPVTTLIQGLPDIYVRRVLETYKGLAEEKPIPERQIDNALNLIYEMNKRVLEADTTGRPEVAEEQNLEIDKTISRSRSEKVLLLDRIMSYWHHDGPWLVEEVVGDRQTVNTTMRVLQKLFEGKGIDPNWSAMGKI